MFGSKWMEWIKSGAFLSLLFILFILCLGARVTGIVEHEILGLILCLLLFIHACRHARWFFAFKDGKWGIRRILSTLTNWFLAFGFLLLLITGIMISPDLFTFLGIESSMTSRQLHSGIAFWLLVLIAIHMGLHGLMIQRKVENQLGRNALLPMAALTLVIGVIGFIDRMLFEKLFLGFAFDFWDPSRPISLYFIFYAAVCAALAIVVHKAITAKCSKSAVTSLNSNLLH